MTDTGIDTTQRRGRLGGAAQGDRHPPGRRRLRRGAGALQRDDRQAAGADRARCADVDDVVAAVNYGREHGLDIAIRGGGHNGARARAASTTGCDRPLAAERGSRSTPTNRTVKIGGGALLGDVDAATNEHGLATPGRDHLDHRRRRADARRRDRPPDAGARPLDRQHPRRRRSCSRTAASSRRTRTRTRTCSGRSAAAAATSASSPRSRPGCTRSTTSSPARCSGRSRARADAAALVPRVHPERARGAGRLLRLPQRPARAAVPGGAAPAEGGRGDLVLDRRPPSRPTRCSPRRAHSPGC